ncbi:microfibrillar-associated protein 1-like protein [Tanacetum coccineum]
MSVTADVSDTVIAVKDKLRDKIGQTKVKRYWPGKAPEWADDGDEDADIRTSKAALESAFPSRDDGGSRNHIVKGDDRRLRRLAENRRLERLKFEEDDEDAVDEKRRRIREKLLQREQEEAATMVEEEEEDEEEEDEEEESEYETNSEDDQMGMAMVKPVFVPKSERDTIAEREKIEEEERAVEELVKRRVQERKVETKQIFVEEIRKDIEVQKNLEAEADVADVEINDDLNNADEYETWKAREIARIKRDREDRDAMVKEQEEIERVRNMTKEERKNPKQNNGAPKQKWRFMQKYYHKGAFFQDDPDDTAGTAGADGVYMRGYSSPTGEDKMDKTILPKVMQVKHFGRSGRTKWTHLVNEDTTDWNNPWTYNDTLRAKYNSQMAGMKPIAKPKGKKIKDWESC